MPRRHRGINVRTLLLTTFCIKSDREIRQPPPSERCQKDVARGNRPGNRWEPGSRLEGSFVISVHNHNSSGDGKLTRQELQGMVYLTGSVMADGVRWAILCEICDDIVSHWTRDAKPLKIQLAAHMDSHTKK